MRKPVFPRSLELTRNEALAALEAISQMTGGNRNAYSFDEWRKATSGNYAEWQALLNAENKLKMYLIGIDGKIG